MTARVIRNVFRVLLVLWSGSLWSLAAWVAPTLFYAQNDRHLAGFLAARLFSVETYLGLAVAVLALLLPGRSRLGGLYAAAALLAVNEWVLKHFMESARAHGSAAGLSFIGFGTQPPTAEWGVMISEGRNYIATQPWLSLFPGLAILFTVAAFNLLGDGLRDALDPRLRGIE